MRLDHIYTAGEAELVLHRFGYAVRPAPLRSDLYEISHELLGGSRTCTVEQLCSYAEGVSAGASLTQRNTPASA